MPKRALVIGGRGAVGSGISDSLRDAGWEVCVVDPVGGDLAEAAHPGLSDRVGPRDLVVVSLAARGEGRAAGEFRPSGATAEALTPRLAALELALSVLDGGLLVELAGGALLAPGPDEAGLVARWQRGVHRALAGRPAVLCALDFFVDPEADGPRRVGERLLDLAEGSRTGICRLAGPEAAPEWID